MGGEKIEARLNALLDRGDLENDEVARLRELFRRAPSAARRLVGQIERLGRERRSGRLVGVAWIAAKSAVLEDAAEPVDEKAPVGEEVTEVRRKLFYLERAWQNRRDAYVTRDRYGGEHFPSIWAARFGAGLVFGLSLLAILVFSTCGPAPMGPSFAIPAAVPAVAVTYFVYRWALRRVRDFEAAEAQYRAARRDLRLQLKELLR